MSSAAPASKYEPLRQSPEPKEWDDSEPKETRLLKPYSCLAYVSLFLANILVTVRWSPDAGARAPLSAPVTSKNIHLLRRPSQYIRFEEVHRPSPLIPRQFKNYPITLAPVDAANQQRILYANRVFMSPIGTVVPEDRRVLVTPTISTIIHFRTIDWDIRLHVSIPALSGAVKAGNISLVLYQLNQTYPIDTAALSFQSRPPRMAKIEDIELAHVGGTSWSRACRSDDVLSFELACSGIPGEGECSVEWWQKQGSDLAVYLAQHATV